MGFKITHRLSWQKRNKRLSRTSQSSSFPARSGNRITQSAAKCTTRAVARSQTDLECPRNRGTRVKNSGWNMAIPRKHSEHDVKDHSFKHHRCMKAASLRTPFWCNRNTENEADSRNHVRNMASNASRRVPDAIETSCGPMVALPETGLKGLQTSTWTEATTVLPPGAPKGTCGNVTSDP